ncbi:MAG: hypothetical protein PGN29_19400 [Gordonia paraffinivorans]
MVAEYHWSIITARDAARAKRAIRDGQPMGSDTLISQALRGFPVGSTYCIRMRQTQPDTVLLTLSTRPAGRERRRLPPAGDRRRHPRRHEDPGGGVAMTDGPDRPDEPESTPEDEPRPEPPRASLPEPPWFAMRDPEPPRGSPEAPPLAASEYRSPESWSAGLEQLAVAGQQRARTGRRRRPVGVIVGAVVVVIAVVVGVVVFLLPVNDSSGSSDARVAFCDPGTRGPTTTITAGQQPTTPVGVVAAFLDAAVTGRSADAARATLSSGAVSPSSQELQAWIAALPASTDGWCASVTTTDSTARVLVDVRVRTADGVATVARQDTFFVSSAAADKWSIDAIVAGSSDTR